MVATSPEEAEHYRALVRRRLSQRNRLTAVVTAVGGAAGLALAYHLRSTWPAMIGLFAGVAAMVLWDIRSIFAPHVVCPNCGDNWEYDGFLKLTACETCGVALPRAGENCGMGF